MLFNTSFSHSNYRAVTVQKQLAMSLGSLLAYFKNKQVKVKLGLSGQHLKEIGFGGSTLCSFRCKDALWRCAVSLLW